MCVVAPQDEFEFTLGIDGSRSPKMTRQYLRDFVAKSC